jgi:hypothetical protein
VENFLTHGVLSDHWQKRPSAVIENADRSMQGICGAALLHRKIAWFPHCAFVKKEVALSVSFSIVAASVRPFGQCRKADATRIRRS